MGWGVLDLPPPAQLPAHYFKAKKTFVVCRLSYESMLFNERLSIVKNIFIFRTLPASKLHKFVRSFQTKQMKAGEVYLPQTP